MGEEAGGLTLAGSPECRNKDNSTGGPEVARYKDWSLPCDTSSTIPRYILIRPYLPFQAFPRFSLSVAWPAVPRLVRFDLAELGC